MGITLCCTGAGSLKCAACVGDCLHPLQTDFGASCSTTSVFRVIVPLMGPMMTRGGSAAKMGRVAVIQVAKTWHINLLDHPPPRGTARLLTMRGLMKHQLWLIWKANRLLWPLRLLPNARQCAPPPLVAVLQ